MTLPRHRVVPHAVHGFWLRTTIFRPSCTAPRKGPHGWATASLLLLLGLDEDAVFHEYLLTNEQLLRRSRDLRQVHRRRRRPGTAEAGPRRAAEYLQAALTQMREKFGSIEGYFADGLGIDVAGQDAIRAHLLEG
ncbi:hypothetical protein GS444_18540 [Rhodococcus hoagii]|nr:hypothetical protein [Prescottella equi]